MAYIQQWMMVSLVGAFLALIATDFVSAQMSAVAEDLNETLTQIEVTQ